MMFILALISFAVVWVVNGEFIYFLMYKSLLKMVPAQAYVAPNIASHLIARQFGGAPLPSQCETICGTVLNNSNVSILPYIC